MYELYEGDSLEVLDTLNKNSVDSIVTDPPYGLTGGQSSSKGFMGKEWDGSGVEYNVELWKKCLKVREEDAKNAAKCASIDGSYGGDTCFVSGIEKDLKAIGL